MYLNEKGYLELLKNVLKNGENIENRNGNTLSTFGNMIKFDNINKLNIISLNLMDKFVII